MDSSCCIMKPNDPIDNMSRTTIKKEDGSPGTVVGSDALNYVFQHHEESSNSLDTNSLMFDLQELLKRDPTLSSLDPTKEEPRDPDGLNGGLDRLGHGGMPIPHSAGSAGEAGSSQGGTFGGSSSHSSNLTASPLLASPPPPPASSFAASPTVSGMQTIVSPIIIQQQASGSGTAIPLNIQSIRHPVPIQSMDTTPPPNANIFGQAVETSDIDFDLDTSNDYFTNAASRNVSLCPQSQQNKQNEQQQHTTPNFLGIKTEPGLLPQQQQQQQQQQRRQQQGGGPSNLTGSHFLHADDNLIFSTTSIGGHSGGATFTSPPTTFAAAAAAASKDLLSSSVPVSSFNSPLSDILTDLSPSGAGGGVLGPTSPPTSVSPHPPGTSASHAGPDRHSTLHKLLLRKEHGTSHGHRPSPVRSPENRKTLDQMKSSLSASNPLLCQQLSKSAPSNQQSYLDRVLWARREPRQHMSSVCSVGESSVADEVNEALSGLSPNELPDISDDETEEGASEAAEGIAGVGLGGRSTIDEDSEDEDEFHDDREEGGGKIRSRAGSSASGIRPRAGSSGKKERHFWQYNVQAKGPKGQKIVVSTRIEDPHVLNDIVDPVFSGDVQLQGIKHSGKARRGDGNDLTPNARKLAAIGKELDQLSKVITDLTPVSDMPFNTRCKSRKEKNKLASRACRLKKKAQHEANKLKCHGLEDEHYNLTMAIAKTRDILRAKLNSNVSVTQRDLTNQLDQTVAEATKEPVAGQTAEFVNRQISKYCKSL